MNLPGKVQFSTNFNGSGDKHYNITTGFDNNGDGNFNDRPQYAAAGTPGAIATRYGLLIGERRDGDAAAELRGDALGVLRGCECAAGVSC